MKILQVTPYFYPAWGYGGVARASYEMSKKLAERGYEVIVYTTDTLSQNSRVEMDSNPVYVDGIKVYYFKNISNYLAYKYHIPIPVKILRSVTGEIKKFDVIHMHGYRHFLNILVHHYAKKYKIPYILQPRGSIPRIRKGIQKKIFDILFGYSIIENASKIIATSRIESGLYESAFPNLGKEKIIHIPNGIDVETYQNLPKRGEFRKKYSIAEDEKAILFLSRIHERKGADILVQAFSKLKKGSKGVKLIIAGPDEGFLDKLKLMVNEMNIEKDVIFSGPLYEKDKLEAYVDADVFVLPSKDPYESFGNVALEASACGTPTIVTNMCGVSEWLKSIEVVDPNPHALYIKLLEILNKPESERIEMGKKAREEAENLSLDMIAENLERIYQEILGENI